MANNNHFELTLDTLAPVGSITGLGDYEKVNKALTIDKGNATFKKVWFDTEANPNKEGAGYTGAEWEAADLAVTSAFNQTGIYYYHLVLMDDVNNESEIYTLGPVHYDQDIPVVTNVIIRDSRGNTSNTNETELTVSFNYSDLGSGAYRAVISGDIAGDLADRTFELVSSSSSFEHTFTLKADETAGKVLDGNKKVIVEVYDKAENVSTAVESNVILLDRELDKPLLLIKKGENNLPEYINYRDYVAHLETSETNIVAYKIWEGDAEPEEWVTQDMGSLNVDVEMTFSVGDGQKSVQARVKDVAGNTKLSDIRTVIIDTGLPTAEIATDKVIISKVVGYDKAILTFGNTADNENGSGINYFELRRNGEIISSGAEVPANYEVVVGGLEDGNYTYSILVKDKALNEKVSNEVIVKVDTKSPTLSITQLNPWYTGKFNVSVSYEDASVLSTMFVWSSTVAEDTTLPDNKIESAPAKEISSANIAWNLEEKDANYMHVMLVDEVGNVSYAHCQFGYDTVVPVIKTCKFTEEAYPSVDATINLTYEDATSGVVEMRVSGDITDGTAEGKWEPIVGTRNVKLTDKDGNKTVLVEIRDAAGLVSSKEITCELDTTFPAPVLNLFEADNTTPKAAHSALASFGVQLEVKNDDFQGGVQYKLYGDFNYNVQGEAGVREADAEWTDFVLDDGKTYMTIGNLFCTSSDGTKNIYVIVKDNAGNETKITDPKSFVYDTTAPMVVVSEIDYNRISKVHVERRNASGLIVGKFADEVHFTLTPDSVIQAYKVCAYIDASSAAAVKDVAAEVAIGNDNGSIHMSDSGLKSQEPIIATIKGADYEAALGEVGKVDGAHIVVVYVQDLAGTWSVAAQF